MFGWEDGTTRFADLEGMWSNFQIKVKDSIWSVCKNAANRSHFSLSQSETSLSLLCFLDSTVLFSASCPSDLELSRPASDPAGISIFAPQGRVRKPRCQPF